MANKEEEAVVEATLGSETAKCKLPDFTEEYTDLWFWQVEAAFESAGITSDKRKYFTIIGQLPTRVMYKLADLRTNPPTKGNMYETIKRRIITEFADSTPTKITKLLSELALGDKKPSQLLAEMRSRAAETPITNELLMQLWLRNLPQQIRAIISADDKIDLCTAANMADRVLEAMQTTTANVCTVGSEVAQVSTNQFERLQQQINELSKKLTTINRSRQLSRNYRSNHRSSTPARSSSRMNANYDTCYYHHRFGNEARKCRPRCNYEAHTRESKN